MRAAIKRGIRDKLVDSDRRGASPVSLGHRKRPSYTSAQLMSIPGAASSDFDRALLAPVDDKAESTVIDCPS